MFCASKAIQLANSFRLHIRLHALPHLVCNPRNVLLEEAKELRVLEVAVLIDLVKEGPERACHLP